MKLKDQELLDKEDWMLREKAEDVARYFVEDGIEFATTMGYHKDHMEAFGPIVAAYTASATTLYLGMLRQQTEQKRNE